MLNLKLPQYPIDNLFVCRYYEYHTCVNLGVLTQTLAQGYPNSAAACGFGGMLRVPILSHLTLRTQLLACRMVFRILVLCAAKL